MLKKGSIAISLILLLSLTSCGSEHDITYENQIQAENLIVRDSIKDYDVRKDIDSNGNITADFSSHLPVIVLNDEVGGGRINTKLSLYDTGENSIPAGDFDGQRVIIHTINDVHQGIEREKKDYYFRMDDDSSWVLLGSQFDKSLIRNYIAFTAAKALDKDVPTPYFCELIIKSGDSFDYRGVYLLFKDNGSFNNLYLSEKDLRSEKNMNNIMKALHSKDSAAFLKYKNYVNNNDLIDYFLLNEALSDFHFGEKMIYDIDLNTGKLTLSLAKNYEFSLDNRYQVTDRKKLYLLDMDIYKNLTRSKDFLNGAILRMKSLNIGELKYDNFSDLIDSAVNSLGAARIRDWDRWPKYKQEKSYEQEIIKVKTVFREHSEKIYPKLYKLSKKDKLIAGSDNYARNTWLFIAFFILFLISIHFVRKRMR